MIGPILLSLHNLRFYQRLMADIRKAIDDDVFADWADTRLKEYNWGCEREKSSN
jgi:queuine tRNA-ribosyltransferase